VHALEAMLGKSAFAAEEDNLLLVAFIFRCRVIHEVVPHLLLAALPFQ
jgi:hypothetical protein